MYVCMTYLMMSHDCPSHCIRWLRYSNSFLFVTDPCCDFEELTCHLSIHWSCRTLKLHLGSGARPFPIKFPWYDNKLHLIMRLQS